VSSVELTGRPATPAALHAPLSRPSINSWRRRLISAAAAARLTDCLARCPRDLIPVSSHSTESTCPTFCPPAAASLLQGRERDGLLTGAMNWQTSRNDLRPLQTHRRRTSQQRRDRNFIFELREKMFPVCNE